MTVAAVTGLQGAGAPGDYLPDDEHVVCEAKHCCAYGAGGRDGQSADISPKTLHDIYLRPWDAFVKAGGRGMMLAHNELNGVQMHANAAIMTQHFRTELGFEGFFASDAGNVGALVGARVAYNQTDAAAIAMEAGMDQTMGGGFSPTITVPGVKSGESWCSTVYRYLLITSASHLFRCGFDCVLLQGKLTRPGSTVRVQQC